MSNQKAILMDIIIVLLVSGLGGFIIAVDAHRGHVMSRIELEVSSILFGAVGFTLCGSMSKGNLFKHLFKVAVGVWIFSLINVIFLGFSLSQWIFGIPLILIMMGLGGVISMVFLKIPATNN